MWLLLLILAALSDLMPSGATLGPLEQAMEFNYKVVFTRQPPPRGLGREQYYPVRLSNGSAFVCVVPEGSQQHESPAALFEVNRSVPAQFLQRIDESFRDLCVSLLEGWWTYRFCWNNDVVQLHLPMMTLGDGVLLETELQGSPTHFLLGVAPSKEALSFHFGMDAFGERFIRTRYPNGDLCDLTKAPRETEIRLYCARNNEIETMTLREVEVCRYVASVTSKLACIPALQQEMTERLMTCHELLFRSPKAGQPTF
ncbi:protein OS-9 isoform X1 [Trypanosoma conorhini]|uniref:Protein OS-9 isoform X1 n=1 Tax=Trypanosoma conorhini TaxID=83891 RepID=A0A3R7NH71_9TRYP|nr:protein OS-9 isoform X1 [Trypanosoma conorhini]RNF18488.1 protein OS-9 isoform X1 [Trypanosoma conorhini]